MPNRQLHATVRVRRRAFTRPRIERNGKTTNHRTSTSTSTSTTSVQQRAPTTGACTHRAPHGTPIHTCPQVLYDARDIGHARTRRTPHTSRACRRASLMGPSPRRPRSSVLGPRSSSVVVYKEPERQRWCLPTIRRCRRSERMTPNVRTSRSNVRPRSTTVFAVFAVVG